MARTFAATAQCRGRVHHIQETTWKLIWRNGFRRIPKYQELKAKRISFGWWLTLAMMVVYYGFILLVAFNKEFLSQRLGDGVMTMGIPIGFGVIVFTIVITAIYVKRANSEFDDLTDAIVEGGAEMSRSNLMHSTRRALTLAALFGVSLRRLVRRRRPRPGRQAGHQLDGDQHVRASSWWARCSSPSGPPPRPSRAADFYTAGGGITGFQNGLAIAGDYMSAASFLGISAAVMATGFDGLIYSIGFLVGWPVITFLMAERLRNLGKFTFADVAAFRFEQTPIRIFAASGTLVVVAFYLIAQMVGAGQLIKLLFGLEYWIAVVIVGALMMVYVLFGGMTATTWVQIIKACLLLGGATFMAFMVLWHFGFSPEAMFAGAVKIKTDLALKDGKTAEEAAQIGQSIMGPGNFVKDPISAISFGMALMFGTAGLPHILMRFFTVPERQGSAQVGDVGHRLDRLLLPADLHHRLRRHHLRADQPGVPGRQGRACWAAATWRPSTWPTRSAATCSSASSRRWPSPPSWRWWPA